MSITKRPDPIYRSDLQQVFQFTDDDLRANRQGRLTDAQVAHLRRAASQRALPIVLITGALGILTLLTVSISTGELLAFLIALAIPVALILSLTVGLTESALGPRLVVKVSGQAHLAYGILDYNPPLDEQQVNTLRRVIFAFHNHSYRLAVGDMEFMLSRDEYHVLAAGLYNVYYVPTIRKVVALDVISLASASPTASATAVPTSAQAGSSPTYPDGLDEPREDNLRG